MVSPRGLNRLEEHPFDKSQATATMLLLGSCSLPATRSHWEEHHQRIWRKSHVLLTALVLIAFGFLLKEIDRAVIPYFALAVSLLSLECAVSLCRRTTVAAEVLQDQSPERVNTGYYFQIRIPISSKPAVGLFFIVRGLALPVAFLELQNPGQMAIDKNSRSGETGYYIVLVPRTLLNFQPVPSRAILVEGPYGSNIVFRGWISTWLTKISKALGSPVSSVAPYFLCDSFARAVTRSKGRPVVFIAQDTAVARVFSYFQCLSQPSIAKDKAAKLYLFCEDWDMFAPYCKFMDHNKNFRGNKSSGRLEYTRDPTLPLHEALNVLGSMVNDEEKRVIRRRMKEDLVLRDQVVLEDSEIKQRPRTEQIVRQVLNRSAESTVIAGRCSMSDYPTQHRSTLIIDV